MLYLETDSHEWGYNVLGPHAHSHAILRLTSTHRCLSHPALVHRWMPCVSTPSRCWVWSRCFGSNSQTEQRYWFWFTDNYVLSRRCLPTCLWCICVYTDLVWSWTCSASDVCVFRLCLRTFLGFTEFVFIPCGTCDICVCVQFWFQECQGRLCSHPTTHHRTHAFHILH